MTRKTRKTSAAPRTRRTIRTTQPAATSEPILEFDDAAAWEKWLTAHHNASDGVWLRFRRKGAGGTTITYAQALEVALCFGWIDGQAKGENDQWWRQRFTPRRARSIWSQLNRERVAALIAAGRMHPAGLAEIARAKRDGRWNAAYAPPSRAQVPPDLQHALDASSRAKAFFATLDSRNRYAILFRIAHAKKPETRARRIADFVAMLAKRETIHPVKAVERRSRAVKR
jgi:uncharacterized protein YdeI (YjbR/CyaY-like superfamily)